MTDTVRKAADILYQRSGVEGHTAQTACQEHAQALHDANLLAPELPLPSEGEDGALEWHFGDIWVEDDEMAVYTNFTYTEYGWLSPKMARNIGLALLAAAEEAEKEE
ncbi:hypothetical protein ABRP62_01590 [Corynebacterium sp. KPL2636]|uniref:hypothetical protein n=1 Tax=Corynebacterium sp. KPL2636 TaxID=3158309 RepID=UPI0032EAFDDC